MSLVLLLSWWQLPPWGLMFVKMVRWNLKGYYLVSRGTLLLSTQLSCSGTLSGGVVCSSPGDWPATSAGFPVGGVSVRVEWRDWPAWSVEPSDWLSAVTDGGWRCGGGSGGSVEAWWLDCCSVNIKEAESEGSKTIFFFQDAISDVFISTKQTLYSN